MTFQRLRLHIRPRLRGRGGVPALPAGNAKGPPRVGGSLLRLSLALAVGYGALAAGLTYWQVVQAQSLTSDPLNPLSLAAARSAPRGTIYDANGVVLARNVARSAGPAACASTRTSVTAPVIGYSSPIFGTAALERAYDAQLTGLVSLRPGDDLLRKFRDQPYNPSDLAAVARQRAAAGRGRPARRSARARSSRWSPARAGSWRSSAARRTTPTASSTRRVAGVTWPRSSSARTRRCSTARRRACTCPAPCSRS